MATTARLVVDEARRILCDPDTGRPVIATDTIKQAVDRVVPDVVDACTLQPTRATLFSTAAGTEAYTTTDVDLDYLDALVLKGAPTWEMEKVTRERFTEIKNGYSGVTRARPQVFMLEPINTQKVQVSLWPVPIAVEAVEALYGVMPSAWGTSEATTTPAIPFSKRATRATELLVAARVAAKLNTEDLNALKLNPGVIGMWERDANELLRKERLAISRLRMEHGPTSIRFMQAWRRS